MKKHKLVACAAALALLAAAFLIYASFYYRADGRALAALASDGSVRVTQTDYGWFFDGPSENSALIFYPGGKVEETAYAPLLHELAAEGVDACLLRVPLRLAFFAVDAADAPLALYDYENWYVGGHSLGGVAAALYAADHARELSGLVLLAAYPTRELDASLQVVEIVGTEDGVLNREKLAAGDSCLPGGAERIELEGGNHAFFGSYGPQRGDGEASLTPEQQWAQTAALIAALPRQG